MNNPTPHERSELPTRQDHQSLRGPIRFLAAAVLVAGFGGGLLAWHPWDTPSQYDPFHVVTRISLTKMSCINNARGMECEFEVR